MLPGSNSLHRMTCFMGLERFQARELALRARTLLVRTETIDSLILCLATNHLPLPCFSLRLAWFLNRKPLGFSCCSHEPFRVIFDPAVVADPRRQSQNTGLFGRRRLGRRSNSVVRIAFDKSAVSTSANCCRSNANVSFFPLPDTDVHVLQRRKHTPRLRMSDASAAR